jgi:cell division septum initiation protein DivIVA
MTWVWVLIPLAAILVGGLQELLKFKSEQQKLGTSTREAEQELAALRERLESENGQLVRRIRNLEAIVTSQTWDEIHGLPWNRSSGDESVPSGSATGEPETAGSTPDTDHVDTPRNTLNLDEADTFAPRHADEEDLTDEQRAERLARRVRNE